MNQYVKETHLMVNEDKGEDYAWIVAGDDCEEVVEITQRQEWGHRRLFVLTMKDFGSCDFTMAYAVPW